MTVILTQTDSNYIELTLGMIKSIELNTSSFELIYINIGKVTDRERNLLKNASQKVRLIDSKANATETATAVNFHDEKWVCAVQSKTKALLDLLQNDYKVLLIDSDCILLRNFDDIFDNSKSFLVCKRQTPAKRKEMMLEYIASFFRKLNYLPNLVSGESFNEKMQWLKLFDQSKEHVLLADKLYLKRIIEKKIRNGLFDPKYLGWGCK